jgi:hypothetical protein
MKRLYACLAALLTLVIVRADRLGPEVEVTCHRDWQAVSGLQPGETEQLLHTLKYVPLDGRNAAILLTIMPNDIPGTIVKDLAGLRRFNRLAAQPYLATPEDPPPATEISLPNGLAVALTSEDPALIGKPTPPGEYKIATTVSVLLARRILIHCTLFYDERDSKDFRQALEILQSLAVSAEHRTKADAI